ncbi:FMN-dependent NADH-azoreductase [Sedimenticola selenatireducens]|uniref:FMN dependent NADH:quinone oxidoreductase n=1 Tax=Sedimenticola selenatireducens TaxID=191960 RepID=A0A557S9K7_9GAMM|nr:FMN-dependent NADH-azoreductase [Sedimenticola selenatireducens]TVO74096.1 FMN-dependent NADH-azoreductase [Sedimenticola selenatireducens]TVT61616.1 MAG: FMN-dependent NADH-azoreductase [Sedimenticola selenatireducens]
MSTKTLLHIDSSARLEGSDSRRLSQQFVQQWVDNHPDYKVVERDLASKPLPHLDERMLATMMSPSDQHSSEMSVIADRINLLVGEFLAADAIVLGVPMYNLGIPSTLKAYIDHIVMAGKTFTYTDTGAVGLVEDKPVYILTARGGIHAGAASDQQAPYLETLFNFIGIKNVNFIHSEGLNMGDAMRSQGIQSAQQEIERLVA